MNGFRIAAFRSALLLASAAAQAPAPTRVRGTITGIDGDTLTVKSRTGEDLKTRLAPNATFAYMKKMSLELHLFNPERPIPNEGHRPWDLEAESTMTNAMVTAVVQENRGSELTLTYKGGAQQVVVPEGIPIVMAVESDRSLLVAGEYAYIDTLAGHKGRRQAASVT